MSFNQYENHPQASDDRLKTNIAPIENALEKICSLSAFTYDHNSTAIGLGARRESNLGVSAQEVQAVLPEAVAPLPGNNEYLAVKYDRLVPVLIAAIKEQQSVITDLKTRLDAISQ